MRASRISYSKPRRLYTAPLRDVMCYAISEREYFNREKERRDGAIYIFGKANAPRERKRAAGRRGLKEGGQGGLQFA